MHHPPSSEGRALRIEGAATIAQAASIRDQLADAVREGGALVVEVAADEVDLTFIQLLVAARRSLEERGGSLALTYEASGALHQALLRGGFIHHAHADAIWRTGVKQ